MTTRELADRLMGVLPRLPCGQFRHGWWGWGRWMQQRCCGSSRFGRWGGGVEMGALGMGGGRSEHGHKQRKTGQLGAGRPQARDGGVKKGAHGDLLTA